MYGQGTGFLDPGFGHIHIARNEGTTPATAIATYLNVPSGGLPRIDVPTPGNCPFYDQRSSPAPGTRAVAIAYRSGRDPAGDASGSSSSAAGAR